LTTEELLKEAQETNHKTIGFKVDFQKVNEDSRIPEYSRLGDAAMDCYADKDVTVPGFTLEEGCGRALVPLGFKMALPLGWETQIRPRSGLALKNGITILNTPGTIDENYRGEVGAILLNTTTKPFEVKKGDRVCQMVVNPLGGNVSSDASFIVMPNVVTELDETNRGEGGFGSSGKN
jgi:dUTP pyrophosphatase